MKLKDKIILALILVLFSVVTGFTAVRYLLDGGDIVRFDLITRYGVSSMAGDGLSGGDTTLEVDFGTTANTACEGNDSRLPTTDEKAAMTGANSPSASNVFATDADITSVDTGVQTATAGEFLTNSGDEDNPVFDVDVDDSSTANTRLWTAEKITSELSDKVALADSALHTHTESDITDLDKYTTIEVDNLLADKLDIADTDSWDIASDKVMADSLIWADKYTQAEADALLLDKADTPHDHNNLYYTESESDALLLDKADTPHAHDDRYYTESESDALLLDKADTPHNHDDRYYTETEEDTWRNSTTQTEMGYVHGVTSDIQDQLDALDADDSAIWGNITGTLSNQTDLQAELDDKVALADSALHQHVEADITDLDKYTTTEVDNLLDDKVALADSAIHTHTESDITDLDKYTTTEVDDLLDLKVDLTDTGVWVVAAAEVNADSGVWEDKYTKSETDNLLDDKLDIADTDNWQIASDKVMADSANWDDAYTKRVDSWTAPLDFTSNTASISNVNNTDTDGYLTWEQFAVIDLITDKVNADSAGWDEAYGWGDHSDQNYFDTDIDTLDDVPEGTTYKRLTATKEAYIDQDVTSASSPNFSNASMTGNVSVWTNDASYFDTDLHTLDDIPDGSTYKLSHNDFSDAYKAELDAAVADSYLDVGQKAALHTQGTDTTLGTMTADIDMDGSYQVVGLQAPASSGEAIRQTAKITEANMETVYDNTHASASDNQNLWEEVRTDTGTTSANSQTDTLRFVGTGDIKTYSDGDTITIAYEGSGGSGDMTKAVYDPNDDGKIAEAELKLDISTMTNWKNTQFNSFKIGNINYMIDGYTNDFAIENDGIDTTLSDTYLYDAAGDYYYQEGEQAGATTTLDMMEYSTDDSAQAAYVSDSSASVVKATGGTITYSGNYVIHTFLSNDTFTPASGFDVDYLVVAGGGSGGNGRGGGGGGGGYQYSVSHAVTAKAYPIVIGGGGAAVAISDTQGNNGSDSTFDTVTANGGGGGGSTFHAAGKDGGCGGGAGSYPDGGAGGTGSQGGDGGSIAGTVKNGAGGGGASEAGESAQGGDGGDGTANLISGTSTFYAGGGGGGGDTLAGAGGLGGGGAGSSSGTATSGTANTGGGGGGSIYAGGGGTSGAGGSGIVIIRYLNPNLQCYSESTIKQQGSYSLKGIAAITGSLNDTLTRTVDPTIDLSDKTSIKYGIYSADRTGSQIKIGIHDSGGTTTEHTANISSTGAWETQTWDISAVSNANKDDIDSIIVTILNADAANTFYIDNIFGQAVATGGGNMELYTSANWTIGIVPTTIKALIFSNQAPTSVKLSRTTSGVNMTSASLADTDLESASLSAYTYTADVSGESSDTGIRCLIVCDTDIMHISGISLMGLE